MSSSVSRKRLIKRDFPLLKPSLKSKIIYFLTINKPLLVLLVHRKTTWHWMAESVTTNCRFCSILINWPNQLHLFIIFFQQKTFIKLVLNTPVILKLISFYRTQFIAGIFFSPIKVLSSPAYWEGNNTN